MSSVQSVQQVEEEEIMGLEELSSEELSIKLTEATEVVKYLSSNIEVSVSSSDDKDSMTSLFYSVLVL